MRYPTEQGTAICNTDPIADLFLRYGSSYRSRAVITLILGVVATLLTGTSINVAIPEVMVAFSIDQSLTQWLSTSYLAASTITMLTTAWLISALGERATFFWASFFFILSSIVGGLSPNIELMIAARIVQGASSGIFLPLTMVTLSKLFPPHRQGMAMGIFGIGAVLAPAFGPTLAGALIDHYSWRAVFYLALPLSLLSLPAAIRYLPQREQQGPSPRFDWIGTLLLSLSVTATLVVLANGQAKGWQSALILTGGALALLTGIAFLWHQLRIAEPLLQLGLFKYRSFVLASVINLIFGAGIYGSTYLVPLLLQTCLGMSATDAGLLLLPAGILLGITFPIAGYLSDRLHPRLLISCGMLLFAYSSYIMIEVNNNTPFLILAWWLVIGRIGLGLIMPAISVSALAPLPPQLLSQGSGTSNFLRQLGGAFGVNLLSVYLSRQTEHYAGQITNSQAAINAQSLELLTGFVQHNLIDPTQQLSTELEQSAQAVYLQASSLGFIDCFMVLAILSLLTLIPTSFLASHHDTK